MDITPFYELKTRLYCTASSGCSVIAEDFRLKRAIENFKSLAEVNKPFAKLYKMCESLLTSDNKASELANCIALADALAVAQRTFADTSETEIFENNADLQPSNVLYTGYSKFLSQMKSRCSVMSFALSSFTKYDVKFMRDPRCFSAFIKKAHTVVKNADFEIFASQVLPMYGKSIVPILKKI